MINLVCFCHAQNNNKVYIKKQEKELEIKFKKSLIKEFSNYLKIKYSQKNYTNRKIIEYTHAKDLIKKDIYIYYTSTFNGAWVSVPYCLFFYHDKGKINYIDSLDSFNNLIENCNIIIDDEISLMKLIMFYLDSNYIRNKLDRYGWDILYDLNNFQITNYTKFKNSKDGKIEFKINMKDGCYLLDFYIWIVRHHGDLIINKYLIKITKKGLLDVILDEKDYFGRYVYKEGKFYKRY